MNREEFLRQLEELLYDIPENERRDAMEYYRNYFEDAGPQNEEKIIEELGSPQEVSSGIKKDLFGENYKEYDFAEKKEAGRGPRGDKTVRNILIAVILVLTFPVWIGLVVSVFGLLVAGGACVLALSIAVIALIGVFMIVGIVFGGVGIGQMAVGFPALGLIFLGLGLLMAAAAIVGLVVAVYIMGLAFPCILRTIVRLCKKPFQKRGASI